MKIVYHIVVFTFLLLGFSACEADQADPVLKDPSGYQGDDLLKKNETFRLYTSLKSYEENGKKKVEKITYSANIIGATDFIQYKGKKIDPSDVADLKKESVVILEFELEEGHKKILEAKRNRLDKDKTMEYLVGNIINDIFIEQDGAIHTPNGHQYENSFGTQDNIRLYFFFIDVNKDKKLRVTYHDKLFGAGLINFSMNKNFDI